MSQIANDFIRAIDTFDAVVQQVPPEKWDNDSPCDGWTAREVLKHQCGVLDAAAEVIRTGEMVPPGMAEEADDPPARWAQTRAAVIAALETEGALEQEGKYWFGPMTMENFVGMVQWDPLTHAWDIAKATGVEANLPDDLVQQSFDRISGDLEAMARKIHLIGDPVPVPDDAPLVDRFVAHLGRTP